MLEIDKSRPNVDNFEIVKKRIERFEDLEKSSSSKVKIYPEKKVIWQKISRLPLVPFRGGEGSPIISTQRPRPPTLQTNTGDKEGLHIGCARGTVHFNPPLIPSHRPEIVPPIGEENGQDQGSAREERDQWGKRFGTRMAGTR